MHWAGHGTGSNAAMVPASDAGQRRWDGVMVEVARKAIADNPGKRILVLGSYRNRYMFVEELTGTKGCTIGRHEGLVGLERVRPIT